MRQRVTVLGQKLIMDKLKKLPDTVEKKVNDALTIAAFNVQGEARRSIQKSPADPDTGRSVPGNPPKTDTGRGVNSIYVDIESASKGLIRAYVGTGVGYMAILEHGSKTIEARPWLFPAAEKTRRKNVDLVVQAIKSGVKK